VAFTYLKVKSAKCLCLLPVVLVLRIWSCLHHWSVEFTCSTAVKKKKLTLAVGTASRRRTRNGLIRRRLFYSEWSDDVRAQQKIPHSRKPAKTRLYIRLMLTHSVLCASSRLTTAAVERTARSRHQSIGPVSCLHTASARALCGCKSTTRISICRSRHIARSHARALIFRSRRSTATGDHRMSIISISRDLDHVTLQMVPSQTKPNIAAETLRAS